MHARSRILIVRLNTYEIEQNASSTYRSLELDRLPISRHSAVRFGCGSRNTAIWKLLNTTPGTSVSYDIARRPLKTSKIVVSDEKIQRRIDNSGGFYRLLSTRKSLYKKKHVFKKIQQNGKTIMSPLTMFSPEPTKNLKLLIIF